MAGTDGRAGRIVMRVLYAMRADDHLCGVQRRECRRARFPMEGDGARILRIVVARPSAAPPAGQRVVSLRSAVRHGG